MTAPRGYVVAAEAPVKLRIEVEGLRPVDALIGPVSVYVRCHHPELEDGPRAARRWGSAPTQVCKVCGAWRVLILTGNPEPWETDCSVDEWNDADDGGEDD